MKVLGPYIRKTDDRAFVVIIKPDGKRTTKSYARHLYESVYGPILGNFDVDHKDGDRTNDSIDNFQLLTRKENAEKSILEQNLKVDVFIGQCPNCNSWFVKSASRVISNLKQNKKGPFCSKHCAGTYSQQIQMIKRGRGETG